VIGEKVLCGLMTFLMPFRIVSNYVSKFIENCDHDRSNSKVTETNVIQLITRIIYLKYRNVIYLFI